jgi:hypothetical protein
VRRSEPVGCSSTEEYAPGGAVRFEQRPRPPAPVVALSEEGAHALGRRHWDEVESFVEVPVLTPRLSSYWLHLVTPVGASVARPLIEGYRNATVVRDDRIRQLVPFELTSFEAAVRGALAAR